MDGEHVVLRYEYLGRTQGLGTFHFGEQTVKDMSLLLAQSQRGQQVSGSPSPQSLLPQRGRGEKCGSARFATASTS